jgi:putative oxidoreductase
MTNRAGLQSFASAALRIVAGGMFAFHGAQKLFGVLSVPGHQPAMWSQLWFGGIIELFGGLLIALGLFTRPAALLASGMMAVAYFQFHWKLVIDGNKFLPIVNGGELAVLYCFVFLCYAVAGAGPVSLDARRGAA